MENKSFRLKLHHKFKHKFYTINDFLLADLKSLVPLKPRDFIYTAGR